MNDTWTRTTVVVWTVRVGCGLERGGKGGRETGTNVIEKIRIKNLNNSHKENKVLPL